MSNHDIISFDRTLALEISGVLILKVLLLVLIWQLWFTHPETRDMTLPVKQVGEKLFLTPSDQNHAAR